MTRTGVAQAPAAVAISRTVLPGAAMIAVTFGLARYGYGLLLPEMRADLGFGANAAGWISSGTYVSYLSANVGVVWVTSRFGPRWAIALAALCAAAGMAVVAGAPSTAVLAVGVLMSGAAAGFAFPPYADLVAQRVPEGRRDMAWSTVSSGTGWGVALAGPIAILAGEHWRVVWTVFVVLAVVVGLLAAGSAPATSTAAQVRRPQLSWTWFFCPRSRPLLVSAVLIGAGSAVWWAFSVDALRSAGLGATSARTVYAVCGAAGILASASGTVFTRVGLRTGYLVACTLLSASLGLLGVAAGQLVAALLAAVLFGVCYMAVIAAQGIWSARIFADHPSAGLAATSTALTLGTIAGPALAGTAVASVGYPMTLLGAAVVTLAALVFCPPGARRRRALAGHRCRATQVRA